MGGRDGRESRGAVTMTVTQAKLGAAGLERCKQVPDV